MQTEDGEIRKENDNPEKKRKVSMGQEFQEGRVNRAA